MATSMTTLQGGKEFGHSMPPFGPHTITAHLPGWSVMMAVRDGDKSPMAKLKSIYPRFTPWGHCRQLVVKLNKILSVPESHFAFPFMTPDIFSFAQAHAYSHHRKEKRLSPGDLGYRVVDVGEGSDAVRVYIVTFPLAKMDGVSLIWGNPGTGVSSRLAEHLLPAVDAGKVAEVPFAVEDDSKPIYLASVPPPTGVPESEAHGKLKERIVELWKRAAITPDKANLASADDVLLFGTGMASYYKMHLALMQWRAGEVVPLGSIFHNTWHLQEEAPQGHKHFARLDGTGEGITEFEAYLEAEAKKGRKISYAFVEFPSNPIVVSADLNRLKALADKFDFILVVDDTIGSFCNIDVSSVADIVLTSTTKSFSGWADVMGGTLVLNPASPRYTSFKPVLKKAFLNEYFAGDAAQMLSNNADYLQRSTILNRNALALSTFLDGLRTSEPEYGITKVLYPALLDTLDNYKVWMRKPTDEFTPGYGCLFSLEFADIADTIVFQDNLDVYIGPHLGAHYTLALGFNAMVLGGDAEVAKYHGDYGVTEQQIRVAVGLEGEEELKKVFKDAMEKVRDARKEREKVSAIPSGEGAVIA